MKQLSIFLMLIASFINTQADQQTILITGGAGYIGSHTAFYLHQKGYSVILLDNLCNAYEFNHDWAPLIVGDCGDKNLLHEIFTSYKVDAVMHFAAFANVRESVTDPISYYENNVIQSVRLLESMVEHNIKTFIFSSTCAVYGIPEELPISEDTPKQPISSYGRSKLMVEEILNDFHTAYGLEYICLRYFNVAGALPSNCLGEQHPVHLIPLVLNAAKNQSAFTVFGDDYPTPDGTCVRDYIHVMDLADAHYKALNYIQKTHKPDAFNLGSESGYSVKEVVAMVKKIANLPFNVNIEPRRAGEPPILTANADKARKILGWKPTFNLENMITDAHEYMLIEEGKCITR